MKNQKQTIDQRIEAARQKRDAAEGDKPIVETEWLGGTNYRIANVRHGAMPTQRTFSSHEALMSAFERANSK